MKPLSLGASILTGRTSRLTAHPFATALILALGYMLLCSAYVLLSGRFTAGAAWSIEQLQRLELLKDQAFVAVTGLGLFVLVTRLLTRIEAQQRCLYLLSDSVQDRLLLLEVEASGDLRFLFVNEAFLKVTGLALTQVLGRRIEDVLPQHSPAFIMEKYREAVRDRKALVWEECINYATGERVEEVAVTPIEGKNGRISHLVGAVRDITRRKQAEEAVRHLSGRVLQLQEEERRRIGRELHDSTAQELAAVAINLGLIQQRLEGRDVTAENLLSDSQAILEQCNAELRTLAYLLHPPLLDEVGMPGAVREYAGGFTQRSGIKVTLDIDPALGRLPADTERALFRVVQESLVNVHRHSGSAAATLRLRREADRVTLEVTDEGRGLPPDMLAAGDGTVAKVGVGIAGMRERLHQLGGEFDIESSGHGTTVRATVPLHGERS